MRLALIQMSVGTTLEGNLEKAERMVRQAAAQKADLVLLPELFTGHYFPQQQDEEAFAQAHPVGAHPWLPLFAKLARELRVILPVSFFERAGQVFYNSLATFGKDGALRGVYRKSHIPDGPGYQEKFYFVPGDTGFQAMATPVGTFGAGICWDQWFPECARALALQGAEVLLYPTAIGSEPSGLETAAMWRRAMVGHAVCNACFVGAANRIGVEGEASFYGTSFICDPRGEILAEAGSEETILVADLDLLQARTFRAGMGFFRDRRPDLYGALMQR